MQHARLQIVTLMLQCDFVCDFWLYIEADYTAMLHFNHLPATNVNTIEPQPIKARILCFTTHTHTHRRSEYHRLCNELGALILL